MTFDDSYLKDIYNIITKQKIGLIDDTGYFNYEDKNTNVIYTFLSEKIKRSWYHHFMGTYGAIIINEGNNFSDNMKEINNILNNKIISDILKLNNNINDTLKGIKIQIEHTMEDIINKRDINYINIQLKNIIIFIFYFFYIFIFFFFFYFFFFFFFFFYFFFFFFFFYFYFILFFYFIFFLFFFYFYFSIEFI